MLSRPSDLSRLSSPERANLLYGAARQASNEQLWRSMLGEREPGSAPRVGPSALDLSTLVAALLEQPAAQPASGQSVSPAATGALTLGPNAAHAPAIQSAAARTGIPPAALAAIVDAESARLADGSWNAGSRNPRSSAAGLGQFLSGTWVGEAERRGTWLNGVATQRGWLDRDGKVAAAVRAPLLALRFEPGASIQATADYARRSLDTLGRAGVSIGSDTSGIARAAYLGHHLGTGDAIRFLRGGLGDERAARLLSAQVGPRAAAERIADAGEAGVAHRQWLLRYVERRVQPDRFMVA